MNQVYFAQSGDRIKIGVTGNVHRRLADIGSHLPNPISLIAVANGGADLERAVHSALTDYRLTGEWFCDCDEVRAVAASVQARGIEAVADHYVAPKQPTETDFGRTIQRWLRDHYPERTAFHLSEITGSPLRTCEYWLSTGSFSADAVCWLILSEEFYPLWWALHHRATELEDESTEAAPPVRVPNVAGALLSPLARPKKTT